jgi:lysophospholipase L1-like esterase
MTNPTRRWRPATATLALLALAACGCAESPALLTAPSSVLSRGAVPQGGTPAPADILPAPNALGATRFLSYGDSITAGVTSSFDGTFLFDPVPGADYPADLDGLLEARFPLQNFTVDNRGQPGEWALQAVSTGRFSQEVAALRPQGVLLLEGINDLNNGQSISGTVAALSQLIDLARLYNGTVLISTMFQTCVSTSPTGVVRQNSADRITGFNAALRTMAAGRQNVHVVDLYAAFGDNCGPDGGVGLLGGDGLHPSDSGYARMAGTFESALRAVFPVRGSFQ